MSARLFAAALAATALAAATRAADEPEPPRTSAREALRARMAEDAKKAAPRPASKPAAKSTATPAAAPAAPDAALASPAAKPDNPATPATPAAPATTAATVAPASTGAPAPAKNSAAPAPATVLPKVEVKKTRITVLDQQLAEQEREIARERKNLKVSETDLALNDLKIAKPLAIFGGDSAQFRQRVASERVELMEAEKDLIEAIAHARTKEQKAELQTQLDQLREMRRQLDKTLR